MYEYIKSLLKFDVFNKGKNNLIENFTNILKNGTYQEIELICKDEKIAKIIINNDLFWNNIKLIVEKAKVSGNIINSIKYLYNYDKNYILKQKEKLFDYYSEISLEYFKFLKECNVDLMQIIAYLKEKNIVVPFNDVVKELLTIPLGKSIIINNIDYFTTSNNKLLKLKNIIIENNINANIDEIIDNNTNTILEEIINNKTGLFLEDLQRENLLESLKKLLESVLNSEYKSYHDIEKLAEGSFSDVYKIGSKAIKIGKERQIYNIDNSELFLQPEYKINIKSGIDKRQLLFVEISDILDTKNVNSENLYQTYKKIRELGYIWMDCRLNNIGRLFKDKKIIIKNEDNIEQILTQKKGDIVILDRDFIYKEDEYKNLNKANNQKLNSIYNYNLIKDFESRFQNELKQNK